MPTLTVIAISIRVLGQISRRLKKLPSANIDRSLLYAISALDDATDHLAQFLQYREHQSIKQTVVYGPFIYTERDPD